MFPMGCDDDLRLGSASRWAAGVPRRRSDHAVLAGQSLAPEPGPPLDGLHACDLAVVGGGFTGLWTAVLAKEREPGRDVVVLEAGRVGGQASGRNGGFCMATLTHGLGNGLSRFPGEIDQLERLGLANLDEIERAVERYAIDCDWRRTGEIDAAVAPWQVDELAETRDQMVARGREVEWFDAQAMQAEIASPTYLAGLWKKGRCAMVDPARLGVGAGASRPRPRCAHLRSTRGSRRLERDERRPGPAHPKRRPEAPAA